MSQKEAAKTFLQMASAGQVKEAYAQYIAESFIHHNQYFKGDRQSLMDAMEEGAKAIPNRAIDVMHIYEDGDTVITHSLVTRADPEQPSIAVVHIFRFENGKVAELWDLGQFVAADSPNENGPF